MEQQASSPSPAFGKMDLLTVVMHELGHVMGLDHSADPTNVMFDKLDIGTRRVPASSKAVAHSVTPHHMKIETVDPGAVGSPPRSNRIGGVFSQPQATARAVTTDRSHLGTVNGHGKVIKPNSNRTPVTSAVEPVSQGLDPLFATNVSEWLALSKQPEAI